MALFRTMRSIIAVEQLPLQQNHLRRRTPSEAQARKILVFGQEHEPMSLRVFPNDSIGRAAEFRGTYVN
jgi:hypothetical protein